MFVNPPYPDYVSGYNAYTASFTRALEELFGRHLDLNLISTAVPEVTRHYDSGRAMRADVVDARVWLGIHFRFADVAARNMGVALASWTLHHYFQPVRRYGRRSQLWRSAPADRRPGSSPPGEAPLRHGGARCGQDRR